MTNTTPAYETFLSAKQKYKLEEENEARHNKYGGEMRIHDMQHCAAATLRERALSRERNGDLSVCQEDPVCSSGHIPRLICFPCMYVRACVTLLAFVYIRKRNCIGDFSFYVAAVKVADSGNATQHETLSVSLLI